jgi:hypothetical protein
LPLLLLPLPHFATQLENLLSSIAAKEISASVLLLPNASLVSVTLYLLAHHSQCKQDLLRKF